LISPIAHALPQVEHTRSPLGRSIEAPPHVQISPGSLIS
jgi:hypothetical protein